MKVRTLMSLKFHFNFDAFGDVEFGFLGCYLGGLERRDAVEFPRDVGSHAVVSLQANGRQVETPVARLS